MNPLLVWVWFVGVVATLLPQVRTIQHHEPAPEGTDAPWVRLQLQHEPSEIVENPIGPQAVAAVATICATSQEEALVAAHKLREGLDAATRPEGLMLGAASYATADEPHWASIAVVARGYC